MLRHFKIDPVLKPFYGSFDLCGLRVGNITDTEADWIGAALPLGAILQVFITGWYI